MKAYRPYETFGMIDKEMHFNTVDELVAFYSPWCKEWGLQLECTLIDNGRVVMCGTSLKQFDECLEEDVDDDSAYEQAFETLIITGCTDDELNELNDTVIS
jgi:hypothetical protein